MRAVAHIPVNSHRHAHAPGQSRSHAAPDGPRAEPFLLRLQTTIGNRAVDRLLRTPASVRSSDRGGAGLASLGARESVVLRQPRDKPDDDIPQTRPTTYKVRQGVTDRIDDAYGAGSLDETRWRALVADGERVFAGGQVDAAKRAFTTLYSDAAKLAQSSRVIGDPTAINVVTGSKSTCRDAKPGLNLSMGNRDQWGANASTGHVDETGKLGVLLNARGKAQPAVAIVLTRSAFKPNKEETLGVLRHEMVHAEHDAEDAANALLANPRDRKPPARISAANSELLGYTEGFMTMFQLAHPVPDTPDHPAFVQLLGALDTGGGVHPWAEADPAVRSDALGRLQEYYCNALDARRRQSFAGWVEIQLKSARRDKVLLGQPAPGGYEPGEVDDETLKSMRREGGNMMGAAIRVKLQGGDFFRGLKGVVASNCKGLDPLSMKL